MDIHQTNGQNGQLSHDHVTQLAIADAHRGDGKRFIVRADEKLTAFAELESAINGGRNGNKLAMKAAGSKIRRK